MKTMALRILSDPPTGKESRIRGMTYREAIFMTVVDQACWNLNQTREAEDTTGENESTQKTIR